MIIEMKLPRMRRFSTSHTPLFPLLPRHPPMISVSIHKIFLKNNTFSTFGNINTLALHHQPHKNPPKMKSFSSIGSSIHSKFDFHFLIPHHIHHQLPSSSSFFSLIWRANTTFFNKRNERKRNPIVSSEDGDGEGR